MNIENLKFFLVLVENQLNFSRAAEHLNIDQGTLSRRIKRLEKDLGDPIKRLEPILINRDTSQLTPAGEVLLKDAVEIIKQVERTKERAYRASRGEIGELGIAVNSSIINSVLPDILKVLHSRFPDVKFVLYELAPQEQRQQLLDYQIDIGFDFLPSDNHPDLISTLILQEPLVIALPESHELASKSQIPLKALANESFVLPSPEIVHFYKQIIDFCKQVFGREPKIVQEATWMLTVLSLVAGGVGVSLLLKNAQNIQRQGVVYRPIEGENLEIQIVALMRRNDQSTVLNEFLQLVKDIVATNLKKERDR
ncbi:LysR family transcriptional regulator (plasmid) [Nostoc sp. UHCC 0302]|uniref:LysR family transcriptional regulator n=1 Tax=Nostoc sp. UHCC 0302 TaxID=3134896 RepID=UPI00311C9CE3